MRCLHCGKRLSLLRKFSDGEFCSAEHRHQFQQQQSDLALARLIEAQSRIDKPKPKLPVLAKPAAKPKSTDPEQVFPMAQLLAEVLRPAGKMTIFSPALELEAVESAVSLPAPPLGLEMRGFPREGAVSLNSPVSLHGEHRLPTPGRVLFRVGIVIPTREAAGPQPALQSSSGLFALEARAVVDSGLRVRALVSEMLVLDRLPGVPDSLLDVTPFELPPEPVRAEEPAPPMVEQSRPLSVPVPQNAQLRRLEPALEWASAEYLVYPGCALQLARVTQEEPAQPPAEEIAPHMAESVLSLPLPQFRNQRFAAAAPAVSWALTERSPDCPRLVALTAERAPASADGLPVQSSGPVEGQRSQPPAAVQAEGVEVATRFPAMSGMAPAAPSLQMVQGLAGVHLKAMAAAAGAGFAGFAPRTEANYGETELPVRGRISPEVAGLQAWDSLQALVPGEAASGQPFAIQSAVDAVGPMWASSEESGYPKANLRTAPPEMPAVSEETGEPLPGLIERQLPLSSVRPTDSDRSGPLAKSGGMASKWEDAKNASPFMPASRLTVDHPDGSGSRQGKRGENRSAASLLNFGSRKLPGGQFWSHAPGDLKWVALGLPLLLVLVVYSFRGSSTQKAEPTTQVASAGSGKTVLGGQLNAVQRVIYNRAAVKLFDDFRGGLGSWQGTEGWAKSWRYGEASFLEPGQLALYTPSVGMKDYTLQFLGQIEKRSLNWVFRAFDERNYYAMRIVITKGGPLPEAQVVRYMVMDGKEQNLKILPIPFTVHTNTLYLVRMDVSGDKFTTYIQGQLVDSFNDDRLSEGGVGFFTPKGDKSYLRWVEVTHQYDYLGRLCALLAPYNLQTEGRRAE